ncbi:hypothetical protein OMU_01883 [Enterococcus avium ATCC 14025]|uniref:Uncharacterized protein n=1 Tax=Enterococcus avium ATCC 14025 TaxID=1140002 RepID=A0AAV3J6H3_ENTAV|nr:hypothetical protein OMU_01883 [Enterococcus avium ATCC 14025]EOU26839.1 hypothetical protein I570_00595 [Enterococcus avium ATCC 14025]STP24145.1 Uncharacterised protein [Enterococcus avium]
MKEKQAFHINGYLGLVGLIVLVAGEFLLAVQRKVSA